MLDPYATAGRQRLPSTGMSGLAASLDFVTSAIHKGGACAGGDLPRRMLDDALHVHATLVDAMRRARTAAPGHCNVPRLHGQLVRLITTLRSIKPGGIYVVPAGWCRPPGEWKEDEGPGAEEHAKQMAAQMGTQAAGALAASIAQRAATGSGVGVVAGVVGAVAGQRSAQQSAAPSAAVAPIGTQHTFLVLVHRLADGNTFALAVVNTGEGLEYHAPHLVPESGVPQVRALV